MPWHWAQSCSLSCVLSAKTPAARSTTPSKRMWRRLGPWCRPRSSARARPTAAAGNLRSSLFAMELITPTTRPPVTTWALSSSRSSSEHRREGPNVLRRQVTSILQLNVNEHVTL